MKTCKVCRVRFEPSRPLQSVCSPLCAAQYAHREKSKAEKIAAREDRKTTKLKRDQLKTRSEWMQDAQKAFNSYRRELLADEPCISCGRYHQGQYHAGHYRSVGACPALRFEELNVWKQCQPCNTHLSGNLINYRKSLVNKIGIEKVEWLESNHKEKKHSIDDLKNIANSYKIKLRELGRNRNER